MAVKIQIKRGTGVPGSLSEGELAFDRKTNRLFIGGEGGVDVQELATAGTGRYFQSPINDIVADATTTAPGAGLPAAAEDQRYILVSNTGSLHANWGTITGVGDNDVVQYDGTDWRVVYDVSAYGEGAIAWDKDTNAIYTYTGSAWSGIDAAVTLQDAYDNGTSIVTADATDGGIAVLASSNITGATIPGGIAGSIQSGGTANFAVAGSVVSGGTIATNGAVASFGAESGSTLTSTQGVGYFYNETASSGASVVKIENTSTGDPTTATLWILNSNTSNTKPAIDIDNQGTAADISFTARASDPTSLVDGSFWYNTTSDVFKYYDGSATQTLAKSLQTAYDGGATITTTNATSGPVIQTDTTGNSDHVLKVENLAGHNTNTAIFRVINSGTTANAGSSLARIANAAAATTSDAIVKIENNNSSNAKQLLDFTQAGLAADINFYVRSGDPTTLEEGDFWYNGATDTFRFYDTAATNVIVHTPDLSYASGDLLYHDGTDWQSGTTLSGAYSLSGSITTSGGGDIVVTGAGSALNIQSTATMTADSGTTVTINGTLAAASATAVTVPTPTAANHAVTKQYADNIAAGIEVKSGVKAGTTAVLPAYAYNNGTGGVGATITASGNGILSIDGFTLSGDWNDIDNDGAVNDPNDANPATRVLIKNETGANEPYNGIYAVKDKGSAGTPFILIRAIDFDGSPASEIDGGEFVWVKEGTSNGDTGWVLISPNSPATVGTDNITFAQFSTVQTVDTLGELTDVSATVSTASANKLFYSPSSGTWDKTTDIEWNDSTNTLTLISSPTITSASSMTISATGAGNDLIISAADVIDVDATTFAVDATGAFSLDSASASNVSVTGGNLTLSTITSGDVIVTSAAAVDVNATGGVTIDGTSISIDGTAASNVSTTAADLTISTITSGTLAVTSAGALDLDGTTVTIDGSSGVSIDGTGASNLTATSGNLTLSTVTSGDVLINSVAEADITAATVDVNSTGAVTIDGTGISIDGTSASNLSTTAANLTVSTITSGTLAVTSAGALDLDGTTVTIDGSGTFSIDGVGASNVTATSGNLTLSTATSGNVAVTSADDVVISAGSTTEYVTAEQGIFRIKETDGSGDGYLAITAATGITAAATRVLTIDVNDANRTLNLGGNLTTSGGNITFTVDETTSIDVSGSAAGALIYKSAANTWIDLALGSRGSVLVANGASPTLQWEAPAAGSTATQYVLGVDASGDAQWCDVIDGGLF